jgi:hypothetical protein
MSSFALVTYSQSIDRVAKQIESLLEHYPVTAHQLARDIHLDVHSEIVTELLRNEPER